MNIGTQLSPRPRPIAICLLGAALALAASPVVAEGTMEQRLACTPDAVRLCSASIPDAEQVKDCLVQNMDGLSSACRVVVEKALKSSRTAGRNDQAEEH